MFIRSLAVGAAAVCAMTVTGVGTAQANTLSPSFTHHPFGVFVSWGGGSGEADCHYQSGWFGTDVHQNPDGTVGFDIPGIALGTVWNIAITCDNGDGWTGTHQF